MGVQQGETIGPYTVVEQIGQGGMATVYRAHHGKLGRDVAIKILHQNFLEDTSLRARFAREAQIIASLDHPHIVPVYDYDEDAGQPYLVMKYVAGVSLKTILANHSLPLAEVVRIMTSLADALTYAHSKGVLHRDIKPSNIMIDENNVPYLTDFGLARIVQAGESTLSADMMLGTPHYISPEQAKGERDLDGRTDSYSLGIILYELIAGCVPYNGDTPYAIVHHHIYSALPLPSSINSEVPAEVDTVLVKALAKDPVDRYPTPLALMEAFRAAIAISGIEELHVERSAIVPKIEPISTQTDRSQRKGKQVVIEHQLDVSEMDFGRMSRGVERGIKHGAGYLGKLANQIQEEFEKERKSTSEEEQIRRRIERRYRERKKFFINLAIYIMINGLLWTFWAFAPEIRATIQNMIPDPSPEVGYMLQIMETAEGHLWPLIITMIWGMGLIVHFITYYFQYGPAAQRREEEIQQQIERSRIMRGYNVDTETHSSNQPVPPVRLTGDGELSESFAVEWQDKRKHKRR